MATLPTLIGTVGQAVDAGDIPDEVAVEFAEQFTPQERVEIVIVAGAMGMLNKINDSLRVPLEPEFEPLVSRPLVS